MNNRDSRPRLDDLEESQLERIRKLYKDTLVTTSKYSFTLRVPHSVYINKQLEWIPEIPYIRKDTEFPTVTLKNVKYLTDIVLYEETEEELKEVYTTLVGVEKYKILMDEYTMKMESNTEQSTKEEEETNTRFHAIFLLSSGHPKSLICRDLKISANQLKYYISLASKNALDKCPRPMKFGQQWYDELSLYLSHSLRQHSSLTEIKAHLCRKLNVAQCEINTKTIHRMIKKIGYSYKRTRAGVVQRNSAEVIKQRHKKSLEYISLLHKKKKILYIDETGFNRGLIPVYGYAKVGEALTFYRKNLSNNCTVICAISQERILGYQCFKGGVPAECFGAFLINLLNSHSEIRENLDDWIFYMDNSPIHKAKSLRPFLEHMRIFYGSPYSPFLNPIEEFFGLWKHYFRKELLSGETDFLVLISRALERIKQQKISKFYSHSLDFLCPAIMKKEIK